MNRDVAKRVIFPDHAPKIRFIALIACSVRRGEMRVEALAVMDTHRQTSSSPTGGPPAHKQQLQTQDLILESDVPAFSL